MERAETDERLKKAKWVESVGRVNKAESARRPERAKKELRSLKEFD